MFSSLLMIIILGKAENLVWSGITGCLTAVISASKEV